MFFLSDNVLEHIEVIGVEFVFTVNKLPCVYFVGRLFGLVSDFQPESRHISIYYLARAVGIQPEVRICFKVLLVLVCIAYRIACTELTAVGMSLVELKYTGKTLCVLFLVIVT